MAKIELNELEKVNGGQKGKRQPSEGYYFIIKYSLNNSNPKVYKSENYDSVVIATYYMNLKVEEYNNGGYKVLSAEVMQ